MTRFKPSVIIRALSRLISVVTEEKQVSYRMFLSEPLRAKFKSMCALKGASMNEVLVQLVEKWIEENDTPSPAKKGKGG